MEHPFVFSDFRKSLGLTQDEFAQMCGTTIRTVQNWENGGTITAQSMKLFRYIEAEMLSKDGAISIDRSTVVSANGSDNNVNVSLPDVTNKFLDLFKSKDAQIETSQAQITTAQQQITKSQEQIDRLLTFIERMQTNK